MSGNIFLNVGEAFCLKHCSVYGWPSISPEDSNLSFLFFFSPAATIVRTDYRDCNDSRLIFLLYGSSLFWLVLTSQDKFFEGLSTNHRLLSTPPPIWWSLNSRFCCYGIMILVKTSLRFLAFQLLTFCLSSEPLGTAQESANASRGKVLQKSRPTSRGFSEILGPQTLACLVAPNIKLYVPRTMSLLKSYPFL